MKICAWLISVVAIGVLSLLQQDLYAEDRGLDAIQFRRVVVPAEDLPLLGGDFVPIDFEELQQLIAKYRDQTNLPDDKRKPKLTQAIYVASLVGQDLVSEASRYSIDYQSDTPVSFAIKPCTLALRGTSVAPSRLAETAHQDFVVDSKPIRYDMQGIPTISIRKPTDFWFGWSLRGTAEHNLSRLKFSFDFPLCLDSQILLKLPPMWRIESENAVARPLESTTALQENSWPDALAVDTNTSNWWSIELSGSTSASFELVHATEAFQLNYDYLIMRERIDYRLQPSNLEVISELHFSEAIAPSSGLVLNVSPGLHISSITLDEQEVEWRPSKLPQCIEVVGEIERDEQTPANPSKMTIRSLASWPPLDGENKIPTIQIDRSYTIDGSGSLSIHPDWLANRVQIENGHVFARSGTSQLGGLGRWDFEWTGGVPSIELLASARKSLGIAESLTRLANDNDGLVATSWVTINANSNPRTALRFLLSSGWTIESVQPTDRRYSTTIQKSPALDNSELEIQLSEPLVNQALTLEIRFRSTSATTPDSTSITFDGGRLIAFRDIKQTDYFWIEPTGRYKIEANTGLLKCRVAEKELSESQRQRLPKIGDVWLIKPDAGQIPRLTFRRQDAPYSVKLESSIQPGIRFLSATYRLRCVPIAGAVSFVSVDVNRLGDTPIRWRQRINRTDGSFEWIAVNSQTRRRNGTKASQEGLDPTTADRIVRVNLETATSEAFELEGYAEFPSDAIETTRSKSLEIPLPLLPEAAQKDATLLVDKRLALRPWDDDSPWTPSGYVVLDSGSEAYQFQYDPVRVVAVDVRTSGSVDQSNAWLSDVVTKYRLYLDGNRELRMEGHFHPNDATELAIDLPVGWQVRFAKINDQAVTTSDDTSSADRIRLIIPRHISQLVDAELSLAVDGPPTVVKHRESVELPSLLPLCPIIKHRYEFWLPPSLSAVTNGLPFQIHVPKFQLKKLWPVLWYESLLIKNPSQNSIGLQATNEDEAKSNSTASNLRMAWSTELTADIDSCQRRVLIKVAEANRSEGWTIVFAGFAIAICLGAVRKSVLPIGLLSLIFAMFIVNDRNLEIIQLAALGWLVGFVLKVINAFHRSKANSVDRSELITRKTNSQPQLNIQPRSDRAEAGVTKTTPHFSASWIGLVAAITALSNNASIEAQTMSGTVYHVVLPIDSDNKLSSNMAYVSESLLKKLYQERTSEPFENLFVSARYGLRLIDQDLRNADGTAQLKLKYEIEVQDLSRPISWPLDAKQASFVSMRVDGSEIPLGSRLRWDSLVLQWTPPKKGLIQVELTIDPIQGLNADGHSTINLNIVPIGGALLDIEAGEIADVHANGLGQLATPALGRFQVAIGPLSTLYVSWKKPEKEGRAAMPSANIENEFALLTDSVLARTKIDFDYGSSNPSFCDIECDAAWQPLGRNWGSATLLDAVQASTNSRRRYRLRWDELSMESRESRTVVIHWAPSSGRASTLNLPNIELPGVRANDTLVRYARNKDSVWTIEGLQNWPLADSDNGFEWMPRIGTKIVAHQKPPNGVSVFLRRSVAEQKLEAKMETSLRFLTSQVNCETKISFRGNSYRLPDVRFALPLDVEVKTVKVNHIDVPFSILKSDEGEIGIQAFVDPTLSSLDSMLVETVQDYRDSAWMTLPFLTLEDFTITEHLASATRVVGQRIAWEGLDFPLLSTASVKGNKEWTLPTEIDKELEVAAWSLRVEPQSSEVPESPTAAPEEAKIVPRFRIDRSNGVNRGNIVSRLVRNEDRWSFHVHGLVDVETVPIDGVLMEIPQSILEGLSCSHRIARFTSPEAGRQLVYVFSDQLSPDLPFEFELRSKLPPVETNATTALPEVRLMGDVEWQQWMIVPRLIANQEARWNLSGARTVETTSLPDFVKTELADAIASSLVVVPTIDRPRIRLSNVAANRLPIESNLAVHALTIETDQSQKISSTFFFVPRGHKSVQIRKPANREVLAVECNGRPVPESLIAMTETEPQNGSESDSILNIRLLSSSMPQQIQVHMRRSAASENFSLGMSLLPEIINASAKNTLLIVESQDGLDGVGLQAITEEQKQTILTNKSLDLLEQSAGFISEAPLTERLQWWKDWEASTLSIWIAAFDFSNQERSRIVSERLISVLDRLQLPFQHGADIPTKISEHARTSYQYEESEEAEAQRSRTVKQFFLMQSDDEASSASKNQPMHPKTAKETRSKILFGWGVWLVTATFLLRVVYRRFDKWRASIKLHLQNRPWWLFVGLGLVLFSLAPSYWFGPAFLLVSVCLAARAFAQNHHSLSSKTSSYNPVQPSAR